MTDTFPKQNPPRRIPPKTLLEVGLPIEELYSLARREGNSKKPIYEIHKWWARRLGHVFKLLLLAATTPAPRKCALGRAFAQLLRRFYEAANLRGITVCDPFMGGGTSVVESLKCGAHVIGNDIDPVAWFITRKEIEPFDEELVLDSLKRIGDVVEPRIRDLYKTTDPTTGRSAEIVNAFWVNRLRCPDCRRAFDAHPHYRLSSEKRKAIQDVFCKSCGVVNRIPLKYKTFRCKACRHKTEIDRGSVASGKFTCPYCKKQGPIYKLAGKGRPISKRLFAIEYTILDERDARNLPVRRFKRATASDISRYRLAEEMFRVERRALPFPRSKIFRRGRFDLRPLTHGYEYYYQLFNSRQLYCLSHIYEEIANLTDKPSREYLLLAFSDCLASNNELVSYAFGYQKATPLFGIHGYQIPMRPVEGNVWGNPSFGRGSFTRCVAKMIAGKRYSVKPFEYRYSELDGEPDRVYTGQSIVTPVVDTLDSWGTEHANRACLLNCSSTSLDMIPDGFVDIVLTDPPFYDNLPYSELSDFYYQWLRPHLDEYDVGIPRISGRAGSLFVRRRNLIEHERYSRGLSDVFRECARVLKRTGMLVFTFHHRDPAAWQALTLALQAAQFIVTAISPVRAEGVSGFHSYEGTPKWDAVVCCRRRFDLIQSTESLPLVREIRSEEKQWTRRFRNQLLPWSSADKASLAFALALRESINRRLSKGDVASLFISIAKTYSLKGAPVSMPVDRSA